MLSSTSSLQEVSVVRVPVQLYEARDTVRRSRAEVLGEAVSAPRIKLQMFSRQITSQKAKWLRNINREIAKFCQGANRTLHRVLIDSLRALPRISQRIPLRDSRGV